MRKQKLGFNWLFLAIITGVCLSTMACKTSRGEIRNEDRKPVTAKNPINDYRFIKGGSFVMGVVDGTDTLSFYAPQRVEVASFYLKKYEVTNYEYRQFVHWVRDSIAHTFLGHFLPPDNKGERWIDWSQPIDWESGVVDELHLGNEGLFAYKKEIDPSKLIYNGIPIYPDTNVWTNDFAYTYNEPMARNYFWHPAFNNYPVVGIDYHRALAYCDWLTKQVFKNKYPPVRLPTEAEWEYAALGLSPPKTKAVKRISDRRMYPWEGRFFAPAKKSHVLSFNCNSGDLDDPDYEYQMLGYPSDGFMYSAPVYSYKPNGFGLYQMAGNVSEWVEGPHSAGIEIGVEENINLYEKAVKIFQETDGVEQFFWDTASQVAFQTDIDNADWTVKAALNYRRINTVDQIDQLTPPFFVDSKDKYILAKGGSWADPPFYMQVGARKMEPLDSLRSYIGFRTAMPSVQTAYKPENKIRRKKARKNKLKFIRRKKD